MFSEDALVSAVLCLPACLCVCCSVPWPGPRTRSRQKRSTAAEVPNPSVPLGAQGVPQPQELRHRRPFASSAQTTTAKATTKPDGQPQEAQPGHHPQPHAGAGVGPGVPTLSARGGSCSPVRGDPRGCEPSSRDGSGAPSPPMRPTSGGILFERNLRTKIIPSNEEEI